MIRRQLLNQESSFDPVTVIGDDIQSLQCGSQHVCWRTIDGKAGCLDGNITSSEADLMSEMMEGVIDI